MNAFRTIGALAAAALFGFATLANATSARDPVISEARANAAQTHLLITGSDLPTTEHRLTLGIYSAPLLVTLATPTRIEALLPAGIEPGTYLLSLTGPQAAGSGAGGPRGDEFWVTLGATGPTGAQGVAGATGEAGTAGATGATGPQGSQGPAGPIGAQGSPGAPGSPGATGPQGPIGNTGSQGPAGPIGAQGSPGAPGSPGATGPQGPIGNTGPQGPAGPQGIQGPVGATGPAGTAGTPTSFVVSVKTFHVASGIYLMAALATAQCPAGSVITGGFSRSWGTWDMYEPSVVGNAWRQNATATIIMAPEHYIEANAVCLGFN